MNSCKFPLLRKSSAEFLGTFFILFAGCGSLMILDRFPGSIPASLIPIIFGLAVAVMVYTFGSVSGAHFNPAVTAAFTLTKHFPLKKLPFYWISQVAGAFAAISLLKLILPQGDVFGATTLSVPVHQGLFWEIFFTFILMFVIMAVATDPRAPKSISGAAIGTAVIIGAWMGGPLTGGSMNPVRSLAPAFFENNLGLMWIYTVGPFLGAGLAAFVYTKCLDPGLKSCRDDNPVSAGGCC